MSKKPLFTLIFELIAMTAIVLLFLSAVTPQYAQGYMAALVDKAQRLEETKGPKIVLIGNSNLAFGMDSSRLEEELGMPVINMGLHGALGNAMHEEMAKINVHEGDIYVICHTNYIDDDVPLDGVQVWTAIEGHLKLWKLLRRQDLPVMIDGFPVYLKKCIELWSSGTGNQTPPEEYYKREAFNQYGDVQVSRKECLLTEEDLTLAGECPGINDACKNRLNELNAYLKARGAEMVVAGYPIISVGKPSEEFTAQLKNFESSLSDSLDCPVISDFTDYIYDQSCFFDTVHHLNDEGVQLRTAQLAEDLKNYLQH